MFFEPDSQGRGHSDLLVVACGSGLVQGYLSSGINSANWCRFGVSNDKSA